MRIVFFVNIIRQARCIRRIEDFINRGYEVEIYGFDREGDNRKLPSFEHTIIGRVSRTKSYFYRLKMMFKRIRDIIKSQNENNLFYIFSLDVAIAYLLAGGLRRKYIYEVSDLMELEVNNKILSKWLVSINRFLIKKSLITIMTSPGFAHYFFKEKIPSNICIIPNKLNRKVISLQKPRPREFNPKEITIGFTGAIRNEAIYNFIEVVGVYFPNIRLNFHGIFTDDKIYSTKIQNAIAKYNNVNYFGPFKNPDDFPEIYSNIDMVLCLYTAKGNDKILEPNKLYEAIFYEKPIIVSKDTYTGKFVEDRNIGYTVNGENHEDIIRFIRSITKEDYKDKVFNCARIAKEDSIDNTDNLFNSLTNILH